VADTLARNARVRAEGTRNLVAAAVRVGARRLVAQSIAWAYAPGLEPHREEDALDTGAEGNRRVTVLARSSSTGR
jgi:nucleoside-diphosphate-sugar epimerase